MYQTLSVSVLWNYTLYFYRLLTSTSVQLCMASITEVKSCKALLGATGQFALFRSHSNRLNWTQQNIKVERQYREISAAIKSIHLTYT